MPNSFRNRLSRHSAGQPTTTTISSTAAGSHHSTGGGGGSAIGRLARSVGRASGVGAIKATTTHNRSRHPPPSNDHGGAPLATFDACIEACDALAAASSSSALLRQQQSIITPCHQGSSSSVNDKEEEEEEEDGNDDDDTPKHVVQTMGGMTEGVVPHCSVLVSPDGALLFTSSHSAHSSLFSQSPPPPPLRGGGSGVMAGPADDQDGIIHGATTTDSSNDDQDRYPWTTISSDNHRDGAILEEEYSSAIVCGNDLTPEGDRDSNGFSARGWDHDAATSALCASRDVLQGMEAFVMELATVEKDVAAAVYGAVEKLRDHRKSILLPFRDPRSSSSSGGGGRLGPMLASGTNLSNAILAMEEYYERCSMGALERWRMACAPSRRSSSSTTTTTTITSSPLSRSELFGADNYHEKDGGCVEGGLFRDRDAAVAVPHPPELICGMLPRLHRALAKATTRTSERECALSVVRSNVSEAQNILRGQKEWAHSQWQRVADEESNIDRLYLLKKMEQQEEEERRRREVEMAASGQTNDNDEGPLSREVWEMVLGVESVDDFTHTGYSPRDHLRKPKVLDVIRQRFDNTGHAVVDLEHHPQEQRHPEIVASPASRKITRADVERESDIRDIRMVAMAADESVEDAAGKLLNMMSKGDTTLRSARLAAESCLLSECNGAKSCLLSLVAMERANLEDRMRHLVVLENAVDAIDVRKDIDGYITTDKTTPGGRSIAGEDDDGGIAAALAVLNSHCEGEDATFTLKKNGHIERPTHFEGWGGGDDGIMRDDDADHDDVPPEIFEDVIKMLFEDTQSVEEGSEGRESPGSSRRRGSPQLWNEEKLSTATDALADKSGRGDLFRKSILYELNNQRSKKTEVEGRANFDALCSVFNAFLAGCGQESTDVSNMKMLMILSQTFYMVGQVVGVDGNDERDIYLGSTTKERQSRIYVKSSICHHDIWSDDDFWDQCLYQCVSESLLKSGVLMNYVISSMDNENKRVDTKDIKWHDLSPSEYAGAASQVHSVVFAQLGTLSHSMLELGCGVPRACNFVRRLSIRYQLPLSLRITLIQHLTKRRS